VVAYSTKIVPNFAPQFSASYENSPTSLRVTSALVYNTARRYFSKNLPMRYLFLIAHGESFFHYPYVIVR
ncbi:MAG: hypothetical protein IJT82_04250, partial [Schwartzia sp.]|nr:hypothetical protein [Schwartzia sp. (in: firmicutes)]